MRVIYMPRSTPEKDTKPGPNVPLLVGGATTSVVGLGAAVRFKDFIWTYKWVILVAIIMIVLIIIFAWKSLKGDGPKEEEPEEE